MGFDNITILAAFIAGALLVTGTFTALNGYFSTFAPEWLLEYI